MTGLVKLHFDVRSVRKDIEALPKIARRVTVNTLNKVGTRANKAAKKFITSHYNIKPGSIKLKGKPVSLRRADARKDNPVFTIFIRRKGRGLFKFGAKQLKTGGISVRVTRTSRKIKSAFISTWRRGQGNEFVFVRDKSLGTITRISPSGRKSKSTKRRSLFGPNVAQLYNSRQAKDIINKTVRLNFQPIFDEDLSKRLAKRRK